MIVYRTRMIKKTKILISLSNKQLIMLYLMRILTNKKTFIMKRIFLLLVFLFIASQSYPQNSRFFDTEGTNSLLITGGYVPKSPYNALKFSVAYKNLLFERFGFYTSLELGLDSDYLANTYGITGSLNDDLFLWGGIDLFTDNGLFSDDSGTRKEFGVGYIPFTNAVVMAGYSLSVGFTIQAGLRIPLMWVP